MMNTNKRGFSLVGLMVVVSALGGMSLIVLNLTKQMTKSSSKYQFDTEVGLMTTEMSNILSDPKKCLATFSSGGANIPSPIHINTKYYIAGNAQAPAGGYGNGGVSINDYAFIKSDYPSTAGFLNITFKNKNILKGTSGPATVSKKITLYVQQDPSGLILSCRSVSTSTSNDWQYEVGAANIFFSGNVGIGNIIPSALLDVTGGVKATELNVSSAISAGQVVVTGGITANQLNALVDIRSVGIIESKAGFKFPDGSTQATSLEGQSCPAGRYISGIDTSGKFVCSSVPIHP